MDGVMTFLPETIFGVHRPVIVMVHLLPLPGTLRHDEELGLEGILERAVADACTAKEGGANGLIIENFGDMPFIPGSVEPITTSCMTRVVGAVRESVDLPCGVSVLRNDPIAAISIAATTECAFVRIGVHAGTMITDQGIIQGTPHETLRLRKSLGSDIKIFADFQVKHAASFAPPHLERDARDLVERGLSDVVVVSGIGSGKPADLEVVRKVAVGIPRTPIFLGSGVDVENVERMFSVGDGAIVGSSVKEKGVLGRPVCLKRVRDLVQRVSGIS